MTIDSLDLQAAADRLGVHYQTAYRWVRSGRLPASLVHGQYQLAPSDVTRFAENRAQPKRARARVPRQGFDPVSAAVYQCITTGDERGARQVVARLVDSGVTVTTVTQEVIVPALRLIGDQWHAGQLSICTEHRAAAIVERILGEHHPRPRGRRRGVAVVAAVSGEQHSLPTTMAALALREDNWTVHHLGADVPAEELPGFSADVDARLVVLTLTNTATTPVAATAAATIRGSGFDVLVGAPGETLAQLQTAARASRVESSRSRTAVGFDA